MLQLVVLALVTVLGLCSASHAQAQAQARVQSKGRVQAVAAARSSRSDPSAAARVAFEQGRYRDALDLYERAYELTGAPVLLYEIGQTADRLRLNATTLRAFQLYLQRYPDAPNHDEVKARIDALESPVNTEGADLDAEGARTLGGKHAGTPEILIPSPYAGAAVRGLARRPTSDPSPLMPSPYVSPNESTEPARRTLWSEPWFWVSAGAAAVLVTTIVIIAASGSASSTTPHHADTGP